MTVPRLKNFQHVFIIMMENTGFDSLIGNPNAPFIQCRGRQLRTGEELLRRRPPQPAEYMRQPPVDQWRR